MQAMRQMAVTAMAVRAVAAVVAADVGGELRVSLDTDGHYRDPAPVGLHVDPRARDGVVWRI